MSTKNKQFDLTEFSKNYPLTVKNLAHLSNREAWLARLWEIERRWQIVEKKGIKTAEILRQGNPPNNFEIEDEFEIIYAGGTLGLLHAAVMATKFNRKVLVFDAHIVGKTHRDWNISDVELAEFQNAGLFIKSEIEEAIINRYKSGFVKFYDANSKIKTPKLWMDNVLDVAVEADLLLNLAVQKLEKTKSKVIDNLRFNYAYLLKDKVLIECTDSLGKQRFFASKMFVDATGTNSPLSRQINQGRSITHICPTVGTVAKGFVRGEGEKEVDFSVGEILVSTEDVADDRQLIWEGFAGSEKQDEYTTYLFFYDSINSKANKSLCRLFEDYFEKLPSYKTPSKSWQIVKPVFGYIPSYHHHGWENQKKTAAERVLLIGDAAGLSSPLTFCGFGSHVRNLRRLTHLTELALKAELFDEKSLSKINAYEPQVAQMSSLAEFMRPALNSKSNVVNETMNAVMSALSKLDTEVSRELFQDRIKFNSFKKVLAKTAIIHPPVFRKMLQHLGLKGSFWWIANIAESALYERKKQNVKFAELLEKNDAEKEFSKYVEFYRKLK